MKTLNIKIIFWSIATAICSCADWNQKPKGNGNVFLIDLTDSMSVVSDFDSTTIRKFFDLDKEPNASAYCGIVPITDMRYNRISENLVEGENYLVANNLARKELSDKFFKSISDGIEVVKKERKGRDRSFICFTIARAVGMLNRYDYCTEKRIVLLSDMMENTEVFSVLNNKTFDTILNSPESLYSILDKEYPLKNPQDIELIIVYRPQNPKNDTLFNIVSHFFRRYYESKEMKVSIATSI